MKIGMKPLMIAGALLITAQAQASGNGAGLQASGPAAICMGANGHPDTGDKAASGMKCAAAGSRLLRPTPRYNMAS